jgi:putative addiction module killer protein
LEVKPRIRETYIAPNETAPFDDWLLELRDLRGKGQIESRLRRVDRGLMGDCEPVADGIIELKIDFGPGYRVYCVDDGAHVLVLCGGTKRTQQADIAKARYYWNDYRSTD